MRRPFADVVPVAMRIVDGYRSVTALEPEELDVLPDLVAVRAVTDAVLFGWRAARHPGNAYLQDWAEVLRLARATSRPRAARRSARACSPPAGHRGPRPLTERRTRAFGPALSPLTYDRPLHLVRGEGVWLIDADGRRYPRLLQQRAGRRARAPAVADAIARQSRR